MYQVLSDLRSLNSNIHTLSKLDLLYFDGDKLKWQTFGSSVYSNETVTLIHKFIFLKAELEESAVQTVEGSLLTKIYANYEIAR